MCGAAAEDDDSLTAEEKAVMRFQQQRLKDAASNKFALTGGSDDEDGGLGLTHGGRPLADAQDQGYGGPPFLNDSRMQGLWSTLNPA